MQNALDYTEYRPRMLIELFEVLFGFHDGPPVHQKGQNRSNFLIALIHRFQEHLLFHLADPLEQTDLASTLASPMSARESGGEIGDTSPCLGGVGGRVSSERISKRGRHDAACSVHLGQWTPAKESHSSRDRWADDDTAILSDYSGSDPLLAENPFGEECIVEGERTMDHSED